MKIVIYWGQTNISETAHPKYNTAPNIRCTDKLMALMVVGFSANLANNPNPKAGCKTNHGAIKVTTPKMMAELNEGSLLTT